MPEKCDECDECEIKFRCAKNKRQFPCCLAAQPASRFSLEPMTQRGPDTRSISKLLCFTKATYLT